MNVPYEIKPCVYSDDICTSPNNLAATVNAARNIEIGYNFATGKIPRDTGVTPSVSAVAPPKSTPVVNTEID